MPSVDLAAASHAARHAVGGADPLTGYLPMNGGIYSGHADDAPFGAVYISGGVDMAANGYPWLPDQVAHLTTVPTNGTGYMFQTIIGQTGTTWTRTLRGGGNPWGEWLPIRLDTGWRSLPLENGWTGTFLIKRTESTAYVSCTDLDGTAATSQNILTLPDPDWYPGAGRPAHGTGNPASNSSPGAGGAIGAVGGGSNQIARCSGSPSDWTGGSASLSFPPERVTLLGTIPGTPY